MERINRKRKPRGYIKRTEEQRAYDVRFCSELFLRGNTYLQITEALNKEIASRNLGYTISIQTVYYDMRQCLIEWKRDQLDNIEEYITQELRKLDNMEREAWAAWEASKLGKERTKNRTSARPRKVLTEEEKTGDWYGYDETMNETSAGNPRFLDLALNIMQRRAKLLGIDKPIKIEIPGVNAASSEDDRPKYNVQAIPDDMLFALADKLQSAEYAKVIEEKNK